MKFRAVHVKPDAGTLRVATQAVQHAPEPRSMIHFDEMRHLMRRKILKHVRRRQDETPRIGEHPGRRARTPAADLVPYENARDLDAEGLGVAAAGELEVLLG